LDGVYTPRDEAIRINPVGDELVLADMQRGVYHGLNAIGAQIWQRLDGSRTLEQIVAEIASDYPDVERATIEADTLALAQDLLDNELVVARQA
jgi:hypothetical protein